MLLLEVHSCHSTSQMQHHLLKMASNQSWNEERVQPYKRGGGMHQLKETDMLTTKVDLLIKRLENQMGEKKEVMHIHDSRMTCEECGDTRHSGRTALNFKRM
jgi:hypothetical protein